MSTPCHRPWCAARPSTARPAWLGWLVALLLIGAAYCEPAAAQSIDFTVALRAAAADEAPDWSQGHLVSLPDDWGEDDTVASSGSVWYRVGFDAGSVAGTAALYALYVERACSVLEVWLNGNLLHRGGSMREPVSRLCGVPQLVSMPAALLLPRGNRLELRVTGFPLEEVTSRQRAGGLSTMQLGPYDALRGHLQRRLLFAIELPLALSGTLLLLGGFMIVMGWFNRAQSYLAYFGALMIASALSLARLWLTELPWPNRMTELMLAALLGFIALAAVQFLMRYAGQRRRWLDRALPAQCALVIVTLVAAGRGGLHAAATTWSLLLWAEIAIAGAVHLRWLMRQQRPQRWLMGTLLGIVALALAAEFATSQLRLDERIGYVAQLLTPLAFMGVGLRLLQQFGRAYQHAERDRAELERRIAEATKQIERSFAQLSELRVEQVTDRERKRIAADLHDDLGAKLLTIVHTSDSERISTLAREALEEMRLSVRGLTGKPVKLTDALGDWRAEMVMRLNQSGIESEWEAPSDEELPQTLSSRAFVQTTRILREAVSNIIKHSGASRCSIACTLPDSDFSLVIQDNGRGIPVELDGRLDKGHGMASMKGRAKQLQGQCLVESSPGHGTVIRLTLPLDRHVTAD